MKSLLLKIYLSEDDRIEGRPAHEWILKRAVELGLRGATVTRGIAGYGKRNKMHVSKILSLSEELPLLIEIVDEENGIMEFAKEARSVMKSGLITVTETRVYE